MRELDLLPLRMQVRPIQASQLIRPRVRMLPPTSPMAAATATKTDVQVAWLDTAFKPIEMLSMPDPATKVQSG